MQRHLRGLAAASLQVGSYAGRTGFENDGPTLLERREAVVELAVGCASRRGAYEQRGSL